MNRILPQIEHAPASLIAISPQTVKHSFFMAISTSCAFRYSAILATVWLASSDWCTAFPIISRQCIDEYLSICPWPPETRVGNSRFQRPTFSTATVRCCFRRSMLTTPSAPNRLRFSVNSPRISSSHKMRKRGAHSTSTLGLPPDRGLRGCDGTRKHKSSRPVSRESVRSWRRP
jgi:hypothetical protein